MTCELFGLWSLDKPWAVTVSCLGNVGTVTVSCLGNVGRVNCVTKLGYDFLFFDEPVTILKKGETELQRPPGLFQNDGRETSRAISKFKRTKEITRKRPFC